MPKKKFKGAHAARSFKGRSSGLQAGVRAIQQDTKLRTDALRLTQIQQGKIDTQYIAGLKDAARFEEGVLKERQKLEEDVRQHKYEALITRRDTDVERLRGIAQEKKDYANYMADLAPKAAAAAADLWKGASTLADTMVGINQFKALRESGLLDKLTDGKVDQHQKIVWDATKDQWRLSQEGDADGANVLNDRTFRLSSYYAKTRFLDWVKENKEGLRNEAIENLHAKGTVQYGENTAIETQELAALEVLKNLGISNTSKIGQEIVEEYRKWGVLDRNGFFEARKVSETKERIQDNYITFKSAKPGKDRQLAFQNLVLSHKNGWFKSDYGKLLNPNNGGGQYGIVSDAAVAAARVIVEKGVSDGTITPDNVRGVFADLTIFPDKKITDKGKPLPSFSTKFAGRFETDVFDYTNDLWVQKFKDDKKAREARGHVFLLKNEQQYEEDYKDKVLSISELANVFDRIEKADIDEASKAKALEKYGWKGTSYRTSNRLKEFVLYLNDGDVESAIEIAGLARSEGGLSTEDENFLTGEVELIKQLAAAQPTLGTDKRRGIPSLLVHFENVVNTQEVGRSVLGGVEGNDSGKVSKYLHAEAIKRFRASMFTIDTTGKQIPATLSPSDRLEGIKTNLLKEFNEGVELQYNENNELVPISGDKGKWKPNKYDYITPKGQTSGLLSAKAPTVYPFFSDPDKLAEIQASQKGEPFETSEDRVTKLKNKEAAIIDFLNKTSKIPLSGSNVNNMVSMGLYEIDDIINHPRFGGSTELQQAIKINEANYKNPYMESPEPIPYHESVTALANVTNMTRTEIVNSKLQQIYQDRGEEFINPVPQDEEDCAKLQTQGRRFSPKDVHAVSALESCRKQGVNPISNALSNKLKGVSDFDAHLEEWDIQYKPGLGFSDPKKFIKNGGLFDLPNEEILNMFPFIGTK